MSPLPWIVITAMIAVNALYVAAEFAAVSVRRSRLRERADAGSGAATRVLAVVKDTVLLDRYIATCQVGITFSSLILGAYGQVAITPDLWPVLAQVFDLSRPMAISVAAGAVLVALTLLQVLLAELVPKSLALQFPTRTALLTFPPVRLSSRILAPFIWLLNGSAMGVLRAMRLPTGSHHHVHSPQEIEMLVAESREGGLLEPEEHRRLVGALHLRALPASSLMVPWDQVVTVPIDADEWLDQIASARFTRVPATLGGKVVGFLHTKDVYIRGPSSDVNDLLREIPRVPASMPGDRLLGVLREERAHLAIVEDEGAPTGLVTFEDVLAELLAGAKGDGHE